jgi:branched-chain amino acid transport system ATP-binding protein
MLLKAENVTMQFGGFRAVSGASISVEQGEIIGLIGPNGAGKSTFFNCLVGDLRPTQGSVWFDGHDVTAASPEQHARLGIGRTFQLPATFEELSILENVMVGAFLRHPRVKDALDAAHRVLELTGLSELAQQKAKSLGTPGRKRLEIARVLATEPKLMLLDEALAGLTPVEVQKAIELVRKIHHSGVTLVIVEHIMEVILSLTDRVLVFNQGQVIASGKPSDVVNDPAVVQAYLGRSLSRQKGRAA